MFDLCDVLSYGTNLELSSFYDLPLTDAAVLGLLAGKDY